LIVSLYRVARQLQGAAEGRRLAAGFLLLNPVLPRINGLCNNERRFAL
jgi:hypothetical protein